VRADSYCPCGAAPGDRHALHCPIRIGRRTPTPAHITVTLTGTAATVGAVILEYFCLTVYALNLMYANVTSGLALLAAPWIWMILCRFQRLRRFSRMFRVPAEFQIPIIALVSIVGASLGGLVQVRVPAELALFLAAAVVFAARLVSKKPYYDPDLDEAERQIRRGDAIFQHFDNPSTNPERAVEAYEEAIRLKPESFEAHYGLARTLSYWSELAEGAGLWAEGLDRAALRSQALRECKEAIRIKPESGVAHGLLGYELRRIGDLEAAVVEFRENIRLNSALPAKLVSARRNRETLAWPHKHLGLVLRKLGRGEDAAKEFAEAQRHQPHWDPGPE
jgi:tetratricopeptide (TPR) repeat protein